MHKSFSWQRANVEVLSEQLKANRILLDQNGSRRSTQVETRVMLQTTFIIGDNCVVNHDVYWLDLFPQGTRRNNEKCFFFLLAVFQPVSIFRRFLVVVSTMSRVFRTRTTDTRMLCGKQANNSNKRWTTEVGRSWRSREGKLCHRRRRNSIPQLLISSNIISNRCQTSIGG